MKEVIVDSEEERLFYSNYEELIRCKDCAYWDECHLYCHFHADDRQWFPNDYCSVAERKEE